ncbi:Mss4-like protein [Lenzites betulinus]|nr:Mss4-like protein [Lenzites betulinus]
MAENVHQDTRSSEGLLEHQSDTSHHPPEDHVADARPDQVSNTGWRGPIPSQKGGGDEDDFVHKPPYDWKSDRDLFKPKYTCECWCGNLAFEFHGDPVDAKYCHCRDCQSLHGAPFQWAVIFPKTSVRMVTNMDDSLYFFSSHRRESVHDVPCKVSCNHCRSPLFDEGRNTVLAYPSAFNFPDHKIPLDFRPTAHIFYGQRIVDVPDGVPKWSGHKDHSQQID